MTPIKRRVMKVVKSSEGGGRGSVGLLERAEVAKKERNAKELMLRLAEAKKVVKERKEYDTLSKGVIPTEKIKATISELVEAPSGSRDAIRERLEEEVKKEKVRQDVFRTALNKEMENDPEVRKLIKDMNAKIERVTSEDVIELIKFLREKYEHKLK